MRVRTAATHYPIDDDPFDHPEVELCSDMLVELVQWAAERSNAATALVLDAKYCLFEDVSIFVASLEAMQAVTSVAVCVHRLAADYDMGELAAACSHLQGLTSLSMTVQDSGSLLQSPYVPEPRIRLGGLTALQHLELNCFECGAALERGLVCALPAMQQLRSLSLCDAYLYKSSVQHCVSGLDDVLECLPLTLTSLHLASTELDELAVARLAERLEVLEELKHLRLENCCLDLEMLLEIAEAVCQVSALEQVHVLGTDIADMSVSDLSLALRPLTERAVCQSIGKVEGGEGLQAALFFC